MSDDTKLILDEIVSLERDVKEIQLTLENEINRKIQMIAEGNWDLVQKPDDDIKIRNEKEMLLIKVTSLQNEVRRLKVRIEKMAG